MDAGKVPQHQGMCFGFFFLSYDSSDLGFCRLFSAQFLKSEPATVPVYNVLMCIATLYTPEKSSEVLALASLSLLVFHYK
jgi:hypothetical protein